MPCFGAGCAVFGLAVTISRHAKENSRPSTRLFINRSCHWARPTKGQHLTLSLQKRRLRSAERDPWLQAVARFHLTGGFASTFLVGVGALQHHVLLAALLHFDAGIPPA